MDGKYPFTPPWERGHLGRDLGGRDALASRGMNGYDGKRCDHEADHGLEIWLADWFESGDKLRLHDDSPIFIADKSSRINHAAIMVRFSASIDRKAS